VLIGAHWSLEIVEKRSEVFKQQTLARFTAELLEYVVGEVCARDICLLHTMWVKKISVGADIML
jgi:hypothetical protein